MAESVMRIAVIGAHGQLGSDLTARLGARAVPLGHDQIDITDPARIAAALEAVTPDVVINAAAYNLVDRAEAEPDVAFRVNAFGPRHLAQWCAPRAVLLVQISTDYVFGLDAGRTQPYCEADLPGPQGVYAASKLTGEHFVRSDCPRHIVVRTCGLYGQAATRSKGNFVQTMLRLGRERSELRVVADQRCTPSFTTDVAAAVVRMVESGARGTYHVTNSGSMTWCEFAREILRQAGINTPVVPITTAEFGAKARRPAFSVLDCSRFEARAGMRLRPWQEALAEYLSRSADRPVQRDAPV
jgi:dTDP-4-dehydrorhamnose reductase